MQSSGGWALVQCRYGRRDGDRVVLTSPLPLATGILAVALATPRCDVNGDGQITVACLGDSNTVTVVFQRLSWCDRLAGSLGRRWHVINHAVSGATVTDLTCRSDRVLCARDQLAAALARDHPDVVILAFGTNDVLRHATTGDTVAAYATLRDRAEALGVRALVALTPPFPASEVTDARRIELDGALRAAFPARTLLDFASRMRPRDFFADGVHLNNRGQRKRARRARRALRCRG